MSDRFLRRPEVETETGLSRATIYRLMNRGDFPRPRRIALQAVAWRASDIENWKASREIAAS
ncbi:helix-turn-helix transcriptional regulator [Qipengyuania sp.]|uniref:helix-turn-helix transcriptional regulator n=1 Tax=Qipengyuania sp. TaxID=2004515 RepID=UPI0035C7E2B2